MFLGKGTALLMPGHVCFEREKMLFGCLDAPLQCPNISGKSDRHKVSQDFGFQLTYANQNALDKLGCKWQSMTNPFCTLPLLTSRHQLQAHHKLPQQLII